MEQQQITKDDGGPASPRITLTEVDREVTHYVYEGGLTVRDYFIAHCPCPRQPERVNGLRFVTAK